MFSAASSLSEFGPSLAKNLALEFGPSRAKNSVLEFGPSRAKNLALEFGPSRAKNLALTHRLCTTVSAPFKGPLNPFPFKDKVFSCISGFRLLLPQTLTIDETYGWNYV